MNLTEINFVDNIEIVRDGKFKSLGFVTHSMPQLLVFLESKKYIQEILKNKNITCVVTRANLLPLIPSTYGVLVTEMPRNKFFEIHNCLAQTDFYWKEFKSEISSDAIIHPTAYIAKKNVRIGRRVLIEPHASILENCIIEDDVIIRAGAVIGCQGFEFKKLEHALLPVAHAGSVRLGNRVEVQANSAISRSVFREPTELGDDTKLDNLVHIAHNAKVGKRCLLAANAMVAGSVTIGDDVWIGPSASISSEIRIGDGASITIGSVVTKDVAPGQRVTGNFAIEHDKYIAFLRGIR